MLMNLTQMLSEIVNGKDLESKLLELPIQSEIGNDSIEIPKFPGRNEKISFSAKQMKFPKGDFHLKEKTALALHSFANHELLAIEIMASVLLKFPARDEKQRRLHNGILQSLSEEQKHFKLYRQRLNDFGYEFGDFPVNDFFWKFFQKIESLEQYLAVMALTFEAANLDFASYYMEIFKEIGDYKTSEVLRIVLEDEIKHVSLGVRYLDLWKNDKSLWDYYVSCLPFPLTAARSKGKIFYKGPRQKAKMSDEFIEKVLNYTDSFRVTNRKEWN